MAKRVREGMVRYTISSGSGYKWVVEGVRIGRFAVRRAGPDDPDPLKQAARPWRVDHIPTGFVAATFDSPDEAFAFADDVSRFAVRDVSGKTMSKVGQQLGPALKNYVVFTQQEGRYVPFRQWAETHAATWSPPRHKMKLPLGFDGWLF